jgi:hypothetical protein
MTTSSENLILDTPAQQTFGNFVEDREKSVEPCDACGDMDMALVVKGQDFLEQSPQR